MISERRKLNLGRYWFGALLALALSSTAHAAPKYNVLFSFNGTDGTAPLGGVTPDGQGGVYGASGQGGSGNCGGGCGLVFKLTPVAGEGWQETVLYNFPGGDAGEFPSGRPAFDPLGNLYGTTEYGGAHRGGTVFRLKPGPGEWKEAVLYNFCSRSGCTDGSGPEAGVVMDGSGNLYGTAGLAYQLKHESNGWKEVVLHDFTGEKGDGIDPYAGLILDPNGNLYGTTFGGGKQCGSASCGTVYELSPQADGKWKETILFRFNGKNGQFPGAGPLWRDSAGALYGTTENGGSYGGVVFRLTPEGGGHWKYAILYEFKGGASGWLPDAGIVMDKSGNLYGTTDGGGGPNGCGVLYKLASVGQVKWKYSVLHTFGRVGDGCAPTGNLTIDRKGNVYGGTALGGAYGYGIVFELTP